MQKLLDSIPLANFEIKLIEIALREYAKTQAEELGDDIQYAHYSIQGDAGIIARANHFIDICNLIDKVHKYAKEYENAE